ncbi:hypothetical protein CCACVL1_16976 [Corchorus capsularis]|uniref:BHLH domain-containing protein n=1 Tax=Corchorus capsularis TaxID=210143 RepID=A0A1R3HUN6_COCAP|nr:hypothetical protein CCACVL1_16976 [Corchorus capsularis]
MSEEVGGHESLSLWENQLWVNVSNSDNTNSGGGSDEKSNSAAKINQQEEETGLQDDETQKKNKRRGKAAAAAGESSDHEMHIWTERERRKKMRNMFSNLHALLPQLPPKADKSTIVDEAVNHIKTLQQTLQKLQKQKLERLQLQSGISFGYNNEPPSMSNLTTTKKQAFESSREAFLADQVSSNDQQLNVSASNNTFSSSISSVSNDHQLFPVSFQTWTSSNVVLNLCGNNQAQISVCSAKKPGLFTSICYILEKHKIGVISAHVSSSNSNQTMFMIQAHAGGEGCNQMSEGFDQVEETFKQAAAEIMSCVSS